MHMSPPQKRASPAYNVEVMRAAVVAACLEVAQMTINSFIDNMHRRLIVLDKVLFCISVCAFFIISICFPFSSIQCFFS